MWLTKKLGISDATSTENRLLQTASSATAFFSVYDLPTNDRSPHFYGRFRNRLKVFENAVNRRKANRTIS
jgi:hypothetical protein